MNKYDPPTKTWLIPKPQWRSFRSIFHGYSVRFPEKQLDEALLLDNPPAIQPIETIRGFQGSLYPFQAKAVGFLVTKKQCLLADEMGLGKTISSIRRRIFEE